MGVRCWRLRIEFLVVTLVALWRLKWILVNELIFSTFEYVWCYLATNIHKSWMFVLVNGWPIASSWPFSFFFFKFAMPQIQLFHVVSISHPTSNGYQWFWFMTFIEIASCHQLESGAPWKGGNPGRKQLENSAGVGLLRVPGILQSLSHQCCRLY